MEVEKQAKTELEQYFVDNLDRAMSEGWIKAYHQPLIRAASGHISDEEALARWEDPERGTFTAGDFVPVLDREHLTYKLDLYMVEKVLEKLKGQGEHDLYIVSESVNLSRSDFDSCDMVEEIAKRIDASGLARDKLSVELSERVIASDVDFMKTQVERFRKEGIKVWMDDYGSGYSSLLLLLKMRFDLLKIDKTIIDEIENSDAGRIILTELIKTALGLGMDTAAEGVETEGQVSFLKEVGCTKLQGYYYIKPVSLQDIIDRNVKGIQIGFENPAESEYYEALGKVNLYDLSISKTDEKTLSNYFDTMPMAIFALDDDKAHLVRCNSSFREFVETNFPNSIDRKDTYYDSMKPGIGYYSYNAVRICAKTGNRAIIDDRTADGRTIQLFMRRIAVNPVTGVSAVGVVVLSVTDIASNEGLTYNYVARALSEDYINLYFVDMDTEDFAEYAADGESRDIAFKKLGKNFFDLELEAFDLEIYRGDFLQVKNTFTKENVEKQLKENGIFSMVARMVIEGKITYTNIKAVKTKDSSNHIIVGINNVDRQMRDREALERAKEEKVIYTRIGALSGDYIYIYTVDPVTLSYHKYNPTNTASDLGVPNTGDNFFKEIQKRAKGGIYREDLDAFLTAFTKDNVFEQIEQKGIFENYHRLMIGGEPLYVVMKAAIVQEEDGDKLIVGILNIDERVRKELEYEENLSVAQSVASRDELTGVKNKHAYAETEQRYNELISKGKLTDFAVAVFDINGLKKINDTQGHQAGDKYIQRGCDTICRFFKHSPVFRVGGDEFVVIVKGYDYLNIRSIITKFRKHNIKNKTKGDVVIAAGMSRYDNDGTVAPVFKRADEEMYHNKRELKKTDT